jgi:hypothetical protein
MIDLFANYISDFFDLYDRKLNSLQTHDLPKERRINPAVGIPYPKAWTLAQSEIKNYTWNRNGKPTVPIRSNFSNWPVLRVS